MKRIFISAACLLMGAAALAQNLNPTVEVTNVYAREASGIEKPSQLLEVPDSVLRFNLDFEYAVNETPYRGAYEFKPYLVQLRPQARPSREGKLFVRAGAGVSLHPELTAVYTPVQTQKLRVNLYADHSSYVGPYHNIALDGQGLFASDGTSRSGKDMHTALGADALLNWRSGTLQANLEYGHILSSTIPYGDHNHHRFLASARIQNTPGTTKVDYDLQTRLSYIEAPQGVHEFHTTTSGMLGAKIFGKNFRMGVQAETVSQAGGNAASFHLTLPRYSHVSKRFSLMAGIKLGLVLRSNDTFAPTGEGHIFPDVQASWNIVPTKLTLYGSVTGGNELTSFDSFLAQNSFINGFLWETDVKKQNIVAGIGLRGNIASRFSYNVMGGYSWMGNTWLWGVSPSNSPVVCFAETVHSALVSVTAGWNDHCLDIQGNLKYIKTLNKPVATETGFRPFLPPSFQGTAHVLYNWGERIKAGVTLEGRSEMTCPGLGALPSYVDLGLQGKFQMTPSIGLWAKAGNLLNQTIQRVPFYAEKGPYFTVGASLQL